MLNQTTLVGYLGQDPVISESKGTPYARLRLANTRAWRDRQGQRQERVTWVSVVAFNGLAKCLEPLGKGDKVAVVGRLQNGTYRTRSGQEIAILEVVADEVDFLRVKAWEDKKAVA